MTIEGLGKKFQEARTARKLTLDEASRMTKIRPSRLAEIEADDFSQFPSLAYAKGFLLIYGKFLDVDVTPYMEAFEGSDAVTVDGYSYLQDNPAPKPSRTPVIPRRPMTSSSSSSGKPASLMPLVIGVVVVVVGYMAMRLILNIQRIAPHRAESAPSVQASVGAPSYTPATVATAAPMPAATAAAATQAPARVVANSPPPAPSLAPSAAATAAPIAVATPSATAAAAEPEVRRAEPVRPEDLVKSTATEGSGPNRVAIKPLKKTYIKVVVDNENGTAFERWISPTDGPVEFRGQHFSVRVLDRDAIQIKKNGKSVAPDDGDVTIE
jgi:cytoskeletal protein RodZ